MTVESGTDRFRTGAPYDRLHRRRPSRVDQRWGVPDLVLAVALAHGFGCPVGCLFISLGCLISSFGGLGCGLGCLFCGLLSGLRCLIGGLVRTDLGLVASTLVSRFNPACRSGGFAYRTTVTTPFAYRRRDPTSGRHYRCPMTNSEFRMPVRLCGHDFGPVPSRRCARTGGARVHRSCRLWALERMLFRAEIVLRNAGTSTAT